MHHIHGKFFRGTEGEWNAKREGFAVSWKNDEKSLFSKMNIF